MQKLRALLAFTLTAAAVQAQEVWHTTKGEQFHGRLAAVYGPLAVLAQPDGSTVLPLDLLADPELGRVADFLAAQKPAAPWKQTTSRLSRRFLHQLQTLQSGALEALNVEDRPEPEFFIVYQGIVSSEGCAALNPELKEAYQRLKAAAPDAFELVFVSLDRDEAEQRADVRAAAMPWPVLRYHEVGNVPEVDRWSGNTVPSLMVLTRDGDLVFRSHPEGADKAGARAALQHVETLVSAMTDRDAVLRTTHRLAIVQELRSAGARALSPQPYLISLHPEQIQAVQVPQVMAALDIDENGHVSSASFQPSLPAALNSELTAEAKEWLFLPAVQNGRPLAMRVKLPLNLKG